MLQVEHVAKAYTNGRTPVPVLADVSLTVAPGERVGLVGRSGAGKSTLARIMALLMPPDRGTVTVDGVLIQRWGFALPAPLRRQVQLIWQSPRTSTNPRYSLRQIMEEPLLGLDRDARRRASARLAQLQERAGLTPELLARHPHAVSDGQLQRACVVRALLVEPKYLICDEFTAMHDASTQATLLHTIAEEQERTGMGIVLMTHDHRLARHWCHRIVELSGGRLVEVTGHRSTA